MGKQLLLIFSIAIFSLRTSAQQCLNVGYCTTVANEHQYPTATFSSTSSTWTTVSSNMNADNYTLFNVTSGNTYEWSYCEAYGGISTGWDAQLTLSDNSSGTNLCFSDNTCGTNGNAPYLSWTASFTGVVKLLTTQANCLGNSGSPYATLVWRMANGTASTPVLGIDVSHYQTITSWPQIKSDPRIFAWSKATEGINYTDPSYSGNMTNGITAGVVMGGYHFSRPETNAATAEANYFLSVASTYIKTCNLPPALDLEDPPSPAPALTAYFTSPVLTQWVQDWMTTVKNATGIIPVLYTSGSIASFLNPSLNIYPLWVADPDGSATAQPANIGAWTNWAFKQYSWTGTVSGISGTANVDMDVFNGNMNAFNTLIGCTTGVEQYTIRNSDFIIYPNPANDNITVESTSLTSNPDKMISIFNIHGQLLLLQPIMQQRIGINVSDFASGIYIIKLETGSGVEVQKFIKK